MPNSWARSRMVVAANPLDLNNEVATWSICSLRDIVVLIGIQIY
ncbi:hypothetical protein [Rufibacter ruber]|nr:hypothetical protein [Rufibacter ruber]